MATVAREGEVLAPPITHLLHTSSLLKFCRVDCFCVAEGSREPGGAGVATAYCEEGVFLRSDAFFLP